MDSCLAVIGEGVDPQILIPQLHGPISMLGGGYIGGSVSRHYKTSVSFAVF